MRFSHSRFGVIVFLECDMCEWCKTTMFSLQTTIRLPRISVSYQTRLQQLLVNCESILYFLRVCFHYKYNHEVFLFLSTFPFERDTDVKGQMILLYRHCVESVWKWGGVGKAHRTVYREEWYNVSSILKLNAQEFSKWKMIFCNGVVWKNSNVKIIWRCFWIYVNDWHFQIYIISINGEGMGVKHTLSE